MVSRTCLGVMFSIVGGFAPALEEVARLSETLGGRPADLVWVCAVCQHYNAMDLIKCEDCDTERGCG